MELSVILLSGNRYSFLEGCLKSLDKSYRKLSSSRLVEVIIAGQNITEAVRNCSSGIQLKTRFYEQEGAVKSRLRNFALSKAEGEIVYFLDDDVYVGNDFIEKIFRKFDEYSGVEVIGGPNLTPSESSNFEKVQGTLLSSRWGAAVMSRRYRPAEKDFRAGQESFALCNLGFRKEMLTRSGFLFDERLNYNEENDLLCRLQEIGAGMVFADINVFHYRRRRLRAFIAQVFESGRGRARSIRISRHNLGAVYLMPLFFALYIAALPFLISFYGKIFFFPLGVYGVFSALASLAALPDFIKEKNYTGPLLLFVLFFISHVSYGAGMLHGFVTKLEK